MTILGIFLAILIGMFIRSLICKKFWGNKIYRTPWWVITSMFILSGVYSPSAVYGLIGLFMYDMISFFAPEETSRKLIKKLHEKMSTGVKRNA